MIFIENLTFKIFFKIILFKIFYKKKDKDQTNNLYILSNYNFFFKFILKIFFKKIIIFNFKFDDLTSSNNPKIGYMIFYNQLNKTLDNIYDYIFFNKIENSLIFYFKKNMSFSLTGHLYRKLYIAEVINWYFKDSKYKKYFFSDNSLFDNELNKFYFSKNIQYISTNNFKIYDFAKLNLLRFINIRYSFNSKIYLKKNNSFLVRNFKNINLFDPELISDVIFHEAKIIDDDLINLYSKGFDFKDIDKKSIEEKKINNLIINRNIKFKFTNLNNIKKINFLSQNLNLYELIYFKKLNIDYDGQLKIYKKILNETKSKITFTHFKYNPDHIPLHQATKEIGGISTMWNFSYEELSFYALNFITDIYFSQSYYNVQAAISNKSNIHTSVLVGYPGDYRFKYSKPKIGLDEKIISFFDEDSSDDGKWYHGNEQVLEDYSFLFNKIIDDKDLFIYFKPKKSNIFNTLKPINDLLKKAIKTNRMVIIESNYNSYPPSYVSLKSNLAIHNNLYAATAGVESILSGTTTFYLDKANWKLSKLYHFGENKFIYNNWKDLWKNIDEYFNLKKNYSSFHSKDLLNYLDPYRDGYANLRMADYLNSLKNGLDQNMSFDDNINMANSEFKKKWKSAIIYHHRG